MRTEMLSHYSRALKRELRVMVYGHGGVPVLAFPTEGAACREYEDFGLVGQLRDYLDGGKMTLYVPDTVDDESWLAYRADPAWRAARQEQYYRCCVDELVPLMKRRSRLVPAVMGCSLGANHAVVAFLRRPELFRGVLALSGVYDTDVWFGGWMNPTLYESSPERFLPSLAENHKYIPIYNRKKLIFVCGRGAFEDDALRTMQHMQRIFAAKGIHAVFDYWSAEATHDWPWWFRQARRHVPTLLGERH
ncbi:MAG: esterase family protein [Clostridia bacterium]|nr:esterase family protein [Clostridia bacterium]